MPTVNRKYMDRLFCFIFGSEENKAWTLSLYNAVNGSQYTDPEKIQITTIKDVLYLGMRNDVSFLLSGEMNLYEQMSTYNPNMPLRFLQYSGSLYEQFLTHASLNKYGSSIIQLPVPKLIVFYNGQRDVEDDIYLYLEDSFPKDSDPDIRVRVRMININHGKNRRILEACKTLQEYSWLVAEIRNKRASFELSEAVHAALSSMPDSYILKPFLMSHKAEVYGMLLTEYNEEEVMAMLKRDARIEGLAEGRAEGRLQILSSLVDRNLLTLETAAAEAGLSVADFLKECAVLKEKEQIHLN